MIRRIHCVADSNNTTPIMSQLQAAGALARWHEAPVAHWNNLEFSALSTAPCWSSSRYVHL